MIHELEAFEDYLRQQERAELTVRGYLTDLRQFAHWFEQTNGEEFSLPAVTPSDVREYRQHLTTVQRHKPATVNRHLASLSALMVWGRKTGRIEHNPTEDVRGVPQIQQGPRSLDRKEQYALQRAIEKDIQLSRIRYPHRWRTHQRDASMAIFLLHTGLRLSEALSLRLDDLQVSERKGLVTVRQGKGGKSRTVPLNTEARKALQAWLDARPESGATYLWISLENGSSGALSGRSVQRALLRLGQSAGLERLTPHVLRHSFAKNLIDAKVGLEKVAALLGHSNLNTTRIYVTPTQRDLVQAVERLEIT
jgi:site-specific recombinase XerD